MRLGNILITGGLGFIGYNIVGLLHTSFDFDRVLIVDQKDDIEHFDTYGLKGDSRIEHVCGSVLDPETFDSGFKADYIIHSAGYLGVQNVADNPTLTMDVNILGTRNCLEYARQQPDLKRIVTFSTSEVFGTYAKRAKEGDPAQIPTAGDRWCYSASKLASEQYTRAYGRDHGVPYTIVRPFNVYGPHRFGSNAVSRFTEAALTDAPIMIDGDGTQERAWCYIDDFTGAVLAAMTSEACRDEDFNVGNPRAECSVHDLAKEVVSLAGSESEIVVTGSTIEDIVERSPNVDKLARLAHYSPTVDLETGLTRTIEWLTLERSSHRSDHLPRRAGTGRP